MRKISKYLILMVALLGLVIMFGCGSKETKSDVKTYKVGSDAAYAPFESVDANGKVVGFDMDIMSAIAKEEGFKVEFVNTAWEGIFVSLKEKKNDMLISAITITEERQKESEYSDPYFESTNYIIVPQDSDIKSIADLKGKKVSVQQGTTGDEAITKVLGKDYAGIKRFKGTPEAFLEMKNKKVDAAVADSGVVMEYVKNNPDQKLKIVKDDAFVKEHYGIAIFKGNTELLNKVNDGLKKIKANGEYDKIFEKYFGKQQ